MQARHGKRDISTADLSGCISTLFDGLVDIGSPPQQFSLLIDTGSTSLAVAGNNCSTCNGLVTGFYEPGPSATAEGVFTSTLYGDVRHFFCAFFNVCQPIFSPLGLELERHDVQ